MDIYGEMSRGEVMALTVEQKKLRKKYKDKINRQNNKERYAEYQKIYNMYMHNI